MVRFFAGLLLLFASLPVAAAASADATDRFTRILTLPGARAIRLEMTVADVTVIGSNRSDVAVEIVRRAPTAADLSKFPVTVDESADLVRIGATQVAEGRDSSLKTDVVVHAPAAARFEAVRVFEGRVRLNGLTGACDVDIRRGSIEATALAGRVRLESGIGSVDVKDSTLTAGGMMRLRTFNGSVRVKFSRAPANARILAVTFNGKITSDIPLTMKDRFGPRFGETTLGSGDPVVSIDVVTGDIVLSAPKP